MNNMRKLATIQKIESLEPIENANRILKARILGCQLVVRKYEFKAGDLCVYIEIDAILPEKPEFEFLKQRKYKIKTIKLRGVISQGIAFSLDILPYKIKKSIENNKEDSIGMDITEILECTKNINLFY